MVDLPLARFLVHRELVEVVVEVGFAGAQVSAQQGRVSGEHGGDVDVTGADGDETNARLPLVEVRHDLRLGQSVIGGIPLGRHLKLADEVRDHVAKDRRVVGLDVEMRDANVALLPKLLPELVQLPRARSDVEENDLRVSVDEPAAAVDLVAVRPERVDGPLERRVVGELKLLNLLTRALFFVRAEQAILVAQLLGGHESLRPYDRVDPADLVGRLPCDLKREAILQVGAVTSIEELRQVGAGLYARITATHYRSVMQLKGREKQKLFTIICLSPSLSVLMRESNRKDGCDPDLGKKATTLTMKILSNYNQSQACDGDE